MAARTNRAKNPPAAPIAPAAAAVLDDSGDMGDANALIRSLTAQREGAEWSVKVYAVPNGMGRGASGRQQFLSECELEDLPSLESGLAVQYPAGGLFRVQIRANNELVRNVTLDIAPRPDYRPPRPGFLGGDALPAPAAAPGGEDRVLAILDRLAENQRQSEERLTRALEAIAARPQQGFKEQIETFTAMQALMPKGAQENGLDMFQKGMDLAQKIFDAKSNGDGGGAGGAGIMDFLIEAIKSPALKEIVAGAVTGAAAAQAPAPIAPAIAPPIPQQQPAPIAGALDPNNPALVAIVEQLCAQAAAGADPAQVAEMALGSIPENIMAELETQPDIVAHLCQLFPQAAPHAAWLERVIANMWEPEIMAAPSPAMAPNAPAPANSAGSP